MAFLLLGLLSAVPAAGAELVDRIVAVVNDEVISLYELDQFAGPYIEQVQNSQYPSDVERRLVFEVRQKVLNQLIDQALTDQELERQGIDVGEPEIDAAIERVKESRYLTDEQLRRSLEEQGITYEAYREQIKKQILRARLVNREIKSKIVITDEDVRRYYEENKEYYAGQTEYHLRNLYVRLPSFVTESDRRRARETLETIRQELTGGAAFESVVNRYAVGEEGIESSDLGYFKLEDLSRELRELLGDMRAGESTPVLETGFGYQIVYVQEIANSEGKSLEEASAEIENKLYNEVVDEKYQSWLQSLRERSYIRIIN
ncbi:MAG TPA: SurA N-terminal domain-containing protein [Desulfobacterales bacterium]